MTQPPRLVPDRPRDAVNVSREELLRIARMAEALKRECGMDPESPQAVRNGQYMTISYALRSLAAAPPAEAPGGRGEGMLPDALVPFAAEWYTFCERAPHAERIKVSGELAEAIVQTVVALAAAPAAPAGRKLTGLIRQ